LIIAHAFEKMIQEYLFKKKQLFNNIFYLLGNKFSKYNKHELNILFYHKVFLKLYLIVKLNYIFILSLHILKFI